MSEENDHHHPLWWFLFSLCGAGQTHDVLVFATRASCPELRREREPVGLRGLSALPACDA
jgi:hypothetical protein